MRIKYKEGTVEAYSRNSFDLFEKIQPDYVEKEINNHYEIVIELHRVRMVLENNDRPLLVFEKHVEAQNHGVLEGLQQLGLPPARAPAHSRFLMAARTPGRPGRSPVWIRSLRQRRFLAAPTILQSRSGPSRKPALPGRANGCCGRSFAVSAGRYAFSPSG